MNFDASGRARTLRALISGVLGTAAFAAMPAHAAETSAGQLEDIVITAQRRETNLQTTPVAVSAVTGEMIAEQKLFTAVDVANSVPAFSLTALTPLDAELNIRGVTNTRLDSPSADPSVGTFVDGVYMGRTGDLNYDFYDLERIEVIRGPQGVLLGKNVVGGALSVITAKPSFENSADVLLSYGNYDAYLVSGHMNGGLSDSIASRLSFQYRKHDGYGKDILHNREVENVDSFQARLQFLLAPQDSAWKTRFAIDFNSDKNNGINTVAVAGGTPNCEARFGTANCAKPWSFARAFLGVTDPRKNLAQSVQYKGDPLPTQQFMKRDGVGLVLDVEWGGDVATFNSLTSFRDGEGWQLYDQTGIGPEAFGWSVPTWQQYLAYVAANRPAGTAANGQLFFANPINEHAEVQSFSQEFRLTSKESGRMDWIVGAYFKEDDITKTDRFIGENFLGALFAATGGVNPLSTLSGENRWINEGKNTNYAVFGQLGFKFTDTVKLSVGVRYTYDKKEGNVRAQVIETGDRFSPNDPRAVVTIDSFCTRPDGTRVTVPTGGSCVAPNTWIYGEGSGFATNYGESWTKTTPQATLEWRVSDSIFTYATVAKGFKGGGFDDTPANITQATTPFDPETATNYELGFKSTLLDRRLRLNADIFYMDYKDLQVTQTNQVCLCNLTDNAAKAKIKGVEAELDFAATERLRLSLAGSFVDAKYKDFIESSIDPLTGRPRVSTDNRLQRTPETQLSGSVDLNLPAGSFGDALNFRVSYAWQSDMYWATDNITKEKAYGTLDARIGFAPQGKSWSVAAWGKNLTDELFRVNIIPFFGDEVSQFGAPRTYGVDFGYKF